MNDWLIDVSPNFTDTENAKLTYTGKRSMSEWELHEESGQQRLDVPGATYWLSEDIGDSYSLVKITVDYAGPNPSKPLRFATEQRAKNYVEYLIEKEG